MNETRDGGRVRWKSGRLLMIWAFHALASALSWLWMGVIAIGLGFKGRAAWSTSDHVQSVVVPAVARTLSFPGRILAETVHAGWLIPIWLGNSLLWAIAILLVGRVVGRGASGKNTRGQEK